jgi:hypothetical protein
VDVQWTGLAEANGRAAKAAASEVGSPAGRE